MSVIQIDNFFFHFYFLFPQQCRTLHTFGIVLFRVTAFELHMILKGIFSSKQKRLASVITPLQAVFNLQLICMVTDFSYFPLQCEKILKSIGLLVGVTEKCGRVERTHKKNTAFFNELSVLLSNLEIL